MMVRKVENTRELPLRCLATSLVLHCLLQQIPTGDAFSSLSLPSLGGTGVSQYEQRSLPSVALFAKPATNTKSKAKTKSKRKLKVKTLSSNNNNDDEKYRKKEVKVIKGKRKEATMGKAVDKEMIQLALGTLTRKDPKGRELVPACTYSSTNGSDQERLTIDGQRILYRNGDFDSDTGKWVPHEGRPLPYQFEHDNIKFAFVDPYLKGDKERPEMVIDTNGFPWRAEHVLRQQGLNRASVLTEGKNLLWTTDMGQFSSGGNATVVTLPIPWDGPFSLSNQTKGTPSHNKLRDGTRIGFGADDERWLIYYSKLAAFTAEFGHSDVPLDFTDEALGRWVNKQRLLYRRYVRNNYYQYEMHNRGLQFGKKIISLTPWRIQMLYDCGLSFKIKLRWEERYVQLAQFFVRHGHSQVPCSDKLSDEEEEFPGLYLWIQNQRKKHYMRFNNGLESSITDEQIALLDNVGLDWKPLDSGWQDRIAELRAFHKEQGHMQVTKSQDTNLAIWLKKQRQQYRLLNGDTPWLSTMTESRLEELNALGVDWEPLESRYQLQLEALKDFHGTHGHSNVPADFPSNQSLADWAHKQRRRFKDGQLEGHHETQLRELDFVFDIGEDYFLRGLKNLKNYKAEYGNCRVPKKYQDKALAAFVINQRTQYRKLTNGEVCSLTEDRKIKLDKVGFDWSDVRHSVWDDRYAQLVAFRSKFGHCNVPKNYQDPVLMVFVKTQRADYKSLKSGKSERLTPERLAKLEAIDFCWNINEYTWMLRYSELAEYRKEFGHCAVPYDYSDNSQLGAWVSNQRTQYSNMKKGKKSPLTSVRIELLESIDFEWSRKK